MKTDADNILYWLWLLALPGIGNASVNLMLDVFGDPKSIYNASQRELEEIKGLKPRQVAMVMSEKDLSQAQKAIEYMRRQEILFISRESSDYPRVLRQIYRPPAALFAKGNLSLLDRPIKVGIVGSRNSSPGGLLQAEQFSRELSQSGITVVSGLAKGIDSAAHQAALDGIGSTIAVLGSGINVCYPRENRWLYQEMIKNNGLILSEFFLDVTPVSYHFPMRNRIISGLSDGVLVVEAAAKSGALITAQHAMEQGKNVYAIPKDIFLRQSAGNNQLLKDGAKLVTDVRDILEDYVLDNPLTEKISISQSTGNDSLSLDGDEARLYEWIKAGYNTLEQLEVVSGMAIQQLNASLSMMELEGILEIRFGNIVLRR